MKLTERGKEQNEQLQHSWGFPTLLESIVS